VEVSQIITSKSGTDIVWKWLPLNIRSWQARHKEVQVGDINIRQGWETLGGKRLKAMVTEMEGSTIQAHVAKLLQASVNATLIMSREPTSLFPDLSGCLWCGFG